MWGGGGADLRGLELEHYAISLPLCFNCNELISYLYKNDKKLKYRQLQRYWKYGIRRLNFAYQVDILSLYAHIYYEGLGLEHDHVLEHFSNNSLPPHAYPIGYFQNLVYFQDIDSIVRQEFALKTPLQSHNKLLQRKITSMDNSVFLHVRLGDYLNMNETNGIFVYLGKTYYQNAIDIMKQKLQQPYIFIFSNDIMWCEKHLCSFLDFSECIVEFVRGNDEGNAAEEMELMRTCRHAIIANSTFSWWAAYLIDNPYKQVIMPSQFFNDERRIPHTDMLAVKGWILVNPYWGTHTIA